MAKAKYADNLIGMKCMHKRETTGKLCGARNYYTRRNKKLITRKIEFKKYCPVERMYTMHKEVKLSGK